MPTVPTKNGSPQVPQKAQTNQPKAPPQIKRENARLQSPEDSDEELPDVNPQHPQQNIPQKAGQYDARYKHDARWPFRLYDVHEQRRDS